MYIKYNLGRHCCLWCEITKLQMATPKEDRTVAKQRTLESLNDDYLRYQLGGSKLSKAKYYNNAIRPALINVPIDQVCMNRVHVTKVLNNYKLFCSKIM